MEVRQVGPSELDDLLALYHPQGAAPTMTHLIFVFGPLKQGFPNFPTNRGRRIGSSFRTTRPYPLYLVGERFSPWLIDAPGQGERVTGQVFEVDAAALAAMDLLERVAEPDGYRRVAMEVTACEDAAATQLVVQAYVKTAGDLRLTDTRLGPLGEYTLAHAALYRRRTPDLMPSATAVRPAQ